VHDADDMTNKFVENGNLAERGRVIAQNHCAADTPAVPEAPAAVRALQGCDAGYPVLMCQTQGKQHDRQDNLAPGHFGACSHRSSSRQKKACVWRDHFVLVTAEVGCVRGARSTSDAPY